MDCLFCDIVAGKKPCYKVFEDDFVLAFLDIFPHCKGHTVVIPKKHFSNIEEMNEKDWQEFFTSFYKVIKRIVEVLKPEGYNLGINNKAVSGQVVPHVHWHIFPRWDGDGGTSFHSIIKNTEKIDIAKLAQLFT